MRKPFSLFATAVSHGWYQTLPFRWVAERGALQRAEYLHGCGVLLVEMTEDRSTRRGHRDVVVCVTGENARRAGVAREIERRCVSMLHLDEDLREFYALCKRTPGLEGVPALGAGRWMRASSLWEDVVKTVLGTNVLWKQAVAMINRLAQLGAPCPADETLRSWPSPGAVLRGGEKHLRDVVRAGYRAPYILSLAHAQKTGGADLDVLDAGAHEVGSGELYKSLVALPGVGKSSAHFIMNLLGHYDHISVDSATFAYAKRALFRGRRPTEAQIRRRFAKFGRWQSLIYWAGRWQPRLEWWKDD